MGRWKGHQHGGTPRPEGGHGGEGGEGGKQPHTVRVCWWRRSLCSATRAFSTSPWKHGTLARSPTCMCATAPRHRIGGSCTHSCQAGQPRAVRVCWCRAVYVQLCDRVQPARGSMGCWQGLQHGGALSPASGLGGARGALAHTQLKKGAATSRTRVLARRRACSGMRGLSTSLWLHGMLVRSPACRCAAARVGVGCLYAHSCSGRQPQAVRAC